MVTSTHHVRRASLLLDRCYQGGLRRVGIPVQDTSASETVGMLATEWLALGAAVILYRSC
jgi:hypothetical protein